MQTRTPATISIYNDGVKIYIGITKEHDSIEIEVATRAALLLAITLLESVGEVNKTLTMTDKKEG